MGRLTRRREDGSAYIENGLKGMLGAAVDKLADLEDAEEQGRLFIAPCKTGDTLYRIDTDALSKNKEVELIVVDNIVICNDGEILLKADAYDYIICTAGNLVNGTPYLDYYRVFTTPEAAEKALEGIENK